MVTCSGANWELTPANACGMRWPLPWQVLKQQTMLYSQQIAINFEINLSTELELWQSIEVKIEAWRTN